eukprot:103841-Amphidinium_carterae.1
MLLSSSGIEPLEFHGDRDKDLIRSLEDRGYVGKILSYYPWLDHSTEVHTEDGNLKKGVSLHKIEEVALRTKGASH